MDNPKDWFNKDNISNTILLLLALVLFIIIIICLIFVFKSKKSYTLHMSPLAEE